MKILPYVNMLNKLFIISVKKKMMTFWLLLLVVMLFLDKVEVIGEPLDLANFRIENTEDSLRFIVFNDKGEILHNCYYHY